MSHTAQPIVATPGQTIGPFYGFALPFERGGELVPAGSPNSMALHGVVTDGYGNPVVDALLEIWQADAEGNIPQASGSLRRDGRTFTGWGRTPVDDDGYFVFHTVNPGVTEAGKAPFISMVIFGRGLMNKLHTRVYLPEYTAEIAADPFLNSLSAQERASLIGVRQADGSLQMNIRLQGEHETVFLKYAE